MVCWISMNHSLMWPGWTGAVFIQIKRSCGFGCHLEFAASSVWKIHHLFFKTTFRIHRSHFCTLRVLSVFFFFTGLCSSDDEISERPLLTLKPSELQNTPSQGGKAHAYMRKQPSTVPLWAHCVWPSVDDGSDWSTLTAESGEDTPPFPVGMETEESEVVRCVCEVDEENDFMIQVINPFIFSRAMKIF